MDEDTTYNWMVTDCTASNDSYYFYCRECAEAHAKEHGGKIEPTTPQD